MEIGAGYRGVLALFLFISLPLLLIHKNTFNSLWNLPEPNVLFPIENTVASVGTTNHTPPSISINKSTTRNHTIPTHINKPRSSQNLLDGLHPHGFDAQSCLSRYESQLYRKSSPYKPSPRLISKLRSYERLHIRCGPNSKQYNATLAKLTTTNGSFFNTTNECNYILALPIYGLGNQMISVASTFLYAILTNRVLLVAFEKAESGLFCEPFLNSTWQLPTNFPYLKKYDDIPTYVSLIEPIIGTEEVRKTAKTMVVPPFLNVNLHYDRKHFEKYFHCGDGQKILDRVPFLTLKSDEFFAPSLFMVPAFKEELDAMFPDKDTVFHHLGRYLFSPSSEPWRLITRYYDENLSKADKKVGIQVRVFKADVTPSKTVTNQILACTKRNNILPRIGQNTEQVSYNSTMAVLVTSLYNNYSESLRAMYEERPTATGEEVHVYQPSHEGIQRYHNSTHHAMALAEIYLLSLCDELVTSGHSTFGYVAQGLGGIKAWIMYKMVGTEFADPPCVRSLSMEPCYQFPPRYECERRTKVQHLSSVFPNMRKCEDVSVGVKMVSEA